jgi:hypothetical protein
MIRRVSGALEATAALLTARVLVATVPFPRLAQMLGVANDAYHSHPTARQPVDPRAMGVALSLARAVPRLPWTCNCLTQAVAGRLMLGRRHIPSSLVFGVRREGGALHAHAWLECAGGYVCGGPADEYLPLATFRTRPSA